MSYSTQDRPTNPSKFFLKVKSGKVSYYDKEAGDNIEVPVPFEFAVLDQLGTAKGWSDSDNSGFWANEVRNSGKEAMTLRTKSGVKATGLWKEIKTEPAASGAKFNASVYITHKSEDGLVISNISLEGASLNAWIEFIQANKGVMKGTKKVRLTSFNPAKKGSVNYHVPVFEAIDIPAEEDEINRELDKELQAYLGEYFGYKAPDEHKDKDTVVEDIDDEPISLDDIPF